MTHLLSSNEIAYYHRRGYLQVDRCVLPAGALSEVQIVLERLFAKYEAAPAGYAHDLGDSEPGHVSVPELIWTTLLAPELLETDLFERAKRLSCELLGESRVRLHFDHAIFKPPLTGGATSWHQDVTFDPEHDCPIATLWIPLQAVSAEQGCMNFIPYSHIGRVFSHESVGRDGRRAIGFDSSGAVSCPLPCGGFTAHHQRTLHGTGPNRTDRRRKAWIIKLAPDHRSLPRRLAASTLAHLPARRSSKEPALAAPNDRSDRT